MARQGTGRNSAGLVRSLAMYFARPTAHWVMDHWIRHDELVRIRQQIRYLAYGQLLARNGDCKDLTLYELSVFSQNGEDGVLNEIIRRIAVTEGTFFEIGASPNESNCALLADALGWSGVFCDSSAEENAGLRAKYRASSRVQVIDEHVTPANVNGLVHQYLDGDDLDVFSIDVDGNEYWLWQGLGDVRPKVVVVEYNSSTGEADRILRKYDDRAWDGTNDTGASLRAFVELGKVLGYELVHAESTGVNLFFVRTDLAGNDAFVTGQAVVSRVPNHFLYGLRHPDPRP